MIGRAIWALARKLKSKFPGEFLMKSTWLGVAALLFSHLAFGVVFHLVATREAPLCEYPAFVTTGFVAGR